MALSAGTRLGPYEITDAIGAGGMGEVYRARDARLNRDVALKVLPAAVALDADRIARFKREAQVLAALNHPNIAAIHGLEESNGGQALVLELVEGPTLADRIAQGPLPLDEALPVAKQIAEALEAAHEQGIVHRDLKPANIKVRDDGTVKVLDFGLAKVSEAGAGGVSEPGGATQSPTITSPALMTGAGVILGTAAYMSPEQARGRGADKRSDVWAFGCVLFEMLAGRRAFDGLDTTDVIAAVVRGEPDWNALPSGVPVRIRDVIKRCLEKDRKARIPEIGVVRYLMAGIEPDPAIAIGAATHARGFRAALIAGAVGIGAVSALATWVATRPGPPAKPDPVRFTIRPPEGMVLPTGSLDRDIAITPDGKRVVYRVGAGVANAQLVVQPTDQLDAVPLRGLGSARSPFVSADGRWIGFESGNELKKVSISGGPPITVSRLPGSLRGASWGADDTIVFATNDRNSGLLSVPAGGGEPKVLTTPDPSANEQDHFSPSFLPGGHAVLFVVSLGAEADSARVAVLDLQTGQRKTLIQGGGQPEYVETGHLLYAAGDTLRAVRFDATRLEVIGDSEAVAEGLLTKPSGAAAFAVSRTGTLVRVAGSAAQPGRALSLVWVDRRGREQPINAPPRNYAIARLSPDATRIALDIRDQDNDIWIWDLARETLTRLTTDSANDQNPVWTPDGHRIVFASSRGGGQNIFWQPADGTTPPERLTTSSNVQYSHSISADGRQVILTERASTAANNVSVLHLDEPSGAPRAESSKRRTEPIVQSRFGETGGDLSKDGRWIAYESNESGQSQIYVQPFPNVNGGRWQVSTNGGTRPVWGSNGREIIYAAGGLDLPESGAVMAVPVQTTPTFSAGKPAKLFDWPTIFLNPSRTFDVSPDGQRFLMIKEPKRDESTPAPAMIVVTLNWLEELKARVPAR